MQKHIKLLLLNDRLFKFLSVLATLIVIYFSLKSPNPNSKNWYFLIIRGDLLLHFICYFGLSSIYFYAFLNIQNGRLYALLLSIIVGILLEILQIILFFRRFFDFQDLIANIIGAIGGVFLNKLFSIKTTNKLF